MQSVSRSIVQEYFADASDDEIGFILWNRTAYPFLQGEELREQLAGLQDAVHKYPAAQLCEQCDNLALVKELCMDCVLAFDTVLLLKA